MQEEKYYTCKYDRPFKEIMLNEKNEDILKLLLESILKISINKIEINNIERNSGNLNIKRKNFDILLTTDQGKIEIEINANDKPYVHSRNMSYLCNLYASHTLVGEIYDEDTNIIQMNFSYGIKDNQKISIYKMQRDDQKRYVKNFIIYDVNMDLYKKIWYSKNEEEIEESKYIIMLDLEKNELRELSQNDKVVSKYMEELNKLNSNSKFIEYMTHEEDERKIRNSIKKEGYEQGFENGIEQGINQGIEQGIEQGINQGIEQGKSNIAKNLIKENIDINIISSVTGLSIEQIKKLQD